jgi:hypothetical protein
MILFFFYSITWWGIGIASESILEVLKGDNFYHHKCFYHFLFFFFYLFYFIIIATSHICGNNSNSEIWVGRDNKPWTAIVIPTHSRVCLEVNTHTETLDYFINDKHIKDRVVNVPKNVYFGVWYFIFYLFLYIYIKVLVFKMVNYFYYFND